jgi:hypothetical protein
MVGRDNAHTLTWLEPELVAQCPGQLSSLLHHMAMPVSPGGRWRFGSVRMESMMSIHRHRVGRERRRVRKKKNGFKEEKKFRKSVIEVSHEILCNHLI